MKVDEIIEAFQNVKQEDPQKFYNAMGYGDDGINIMHPFMGGSYELGLVAGAMYALEHLAVKMEEKYSLEHLSVEMGEKQITFMKK